MGWGGGGGGGGRRHPWTREGKSLLSEAGIPSSDSKLVRGVAKTTCEVVI